MGIVFAILVGIPLALWFTSLALSALPNKKEDAREKARLKERIRELEQELAEKDSLHNKEISKIENMYLDRLTEKSYQNQSTVTPYSPIIPPQKVTPSVAPTNVPVGWSSEIEALYQTGIKKGRLRAALSEDITRRMVNVSKVRSFVSVCEFIEIVPSSRWTKEEACYHTSLQGCTCKDCQFHKRSPRYACKHMFTLAMHMNLITIAGKAIPPPQDKK